ncbi:MAG: hypothetical protein ACR2KL_10800 [Nocardioidaceae bacterium]
MGLDHAGGQSPDPPSHKVPDRDARRVAGAQLRILRPHAEVAPPEAERRAGVQLRPGRRLPVPEARDARSIAAEQLSRVAELHPDRPVGELVSEGSIQPLVIDLVALDRCAEPEAAQVRTFTEDIVARRRDQRRRELVFLRHDDVSTMSALLACQESAVTGRLERLGVLA